MADLQQQLRSILGDPEAMSRIAALARTLTGPGEGPAPAAGPEPEEQPELIPAGRETEEPVSSSLSGPAGTAEVPDLTALLSAFSGEPGTGFDPRLLQIAGEVFSAYSTEDNEKSALLSALKPFLSQHRQEKLEQADRIIRLLRAARTGFQLWQEDGHV